MGTSTTTDEHHLVQVWHVGFGVNLFWLLVVLAVVAVVVSMYFLRRRGNQSP